MLSELRLPAIWPTPPGSRANSRLSTRSVGSSSRHSSQRSASAEPSHAPVTDLWANLPARAKSIEPGADSPLRAGILVNRSELWDTMYLTDSGVDLGLPPAPSHGYILSGAVDKQNKRATGGCCRACRAAPTHRLLPPRRPRA